MLSDRKSQIILISKTIIDKAVERVNLTESCRQRDFFMRRLIIAAVLTLLILLWSKVFYWPAEEGTFDW